MKIKCIRSTSILKILLIGFLLLNGFVLLYGSTFLRPSADDYCFGTTVAQNGVLRGLYSWWMSWSAFMFSIFFVNLFAGAPLAYLPPSLASAVPFLFSMFGVGIVAYAFFPEQLREKSSKLIFCFSAGFFWWTFLWSRDALGRSIKNFSSIAESITHWQSINTGYILPTLVLLFVYAWIKQQLGVNNILFRSVAVFSGIAASMAGSAVSLGWFLFGLAAIGCGGLGFFRRRTSASPRVKIDPKLWILFCLVIIIGVLLSHTLSPGHAIRQKILNPNLTISFMRLCELVSFTFKETVKFLYETYASYPGIFLMLTSASFASIFVKIYPESMQHIIPQLIKDSASFGILSLAMAIAASIGGFFTYHTYWHFAVATVSAYFSIFFAGMALGLFITLKFTNKHIVLVILFAFTMLFSTYVNFHAIGGIFERESRWRIGPAPTRAVKDIEELWIENCFNSLNKHRMHPIIREPHQESIPEL